MPARSARVSRVRAAACSVRSGQMLEAARRLAAGPGVANAGFEEGGARSKGRWFGHLPRPPYAAQRVTRTNRELNPTRSASRPASATRTGFRSTPADSTSLPKADVAASHRTTNPKPHPTSATRTAPPPGRRSLAASGASSAATRRPNCGSSPRRCKLAMHPDTTAPTWLASRRHGGGSPG